MGKLGMFGSKTNSIKAEYDKFRKKNYEIFPYQT